ncbi:hypothetical protein EG328_008824 [Venturia inaequalis]|uniref:Uncharacterized protein n=1 Tax=Venturia inaequalis TaxID=5025 RepID=A0A8H3V0S7_VENIN|nr:hypothetical protein EG328_008824 [Venturia inaequalis]KAE9979910.1 hypothetical protein EG327_006856 [Venturia inaequalis]
MNDEDGNPMFAFQDIDYIPFGFSSHLAPYIETGPGTMRAAAKLMRLGLVRASIAQGVGIDYNAKLIETAGINSALIKDIKIDWLVYDFNDDKEDLVNQLITAHHVTHVFIYLTPKQLALPTVRSILTRLCAESVVNGNDERSTVNHSTMVLPLLNRIDARVFGGKHKTSLVVLICPLPSFYGEVERPERQVHAVSIVKTFKELRTRWICIAS